MDRSGAATASVGEERLLVPGGIPGEEVRVERLRPVGRSVLCELQGVVRASPNRVTPRCRHARECGGCTWQHIAYPEQLRRKSAALGALLRRSMGEGAPRVAPAIGMPVGADGMPWGFRQKAAFVFGERAEGLVMGHFARGTHEVVPVVECPVHPPRANRVAFALRDALRAAGVGVASREPGGLLRHVVVRSSGDESEAVAMLVVTRDDRRLELPLRRVLEGSERPDGLVVNVNDREGPYLVGRESRRVAGTGHVREAALGPSFLVSPGSFFQTNVHAAATLVRLVLEALPGDSGLRVLDLYSGGGLFALPIALRGHRVTAVEDSRKANRDAELNRRQNAVPLGALELLASSVERALPRLAPGSFDAVILDPPRDGAPEPVIRGVFERLRPARGILVSCNPEALARELPLAVAAGYRVLRVQPVDMFPHTPHVEAVAVLERRESRRERGAAAVGPEPARAPAPSRRHGPSRLADRRQAPARSDARRDDRGIRPRRRS